MHISPHPIPRFDDRSARSSPVRLPRVLAFALVLLLAGIAIVFGVYGIAAPNPCGEDQAVCVFQ